MKSNRWLSILLAVMLVFSLSSCKSPDKQASSSPEEVLTRITAPEILRAVTVSAENSSDYPGSVSDAESLEAYAQDLIDFARENSMNAILYEATPFGEASYDSDILPHLQTLKINSSHDPLQILIEKAAAAEIAVYVQLSPYDAGNDSQKAAKGSLADNVPEATLSLSEGRFYRPDHPSVHTQAVAAAAELAQNYAISGIVIGDADNSRISDYSGYYTYLSALLGDIADTVHSVAQDVPVGLLVSADHQANANRSAFFDEACRTSVDFLIASADGSVQNELSSLYAQAVSSCLNTAQSYGVDVVTSIPSGIDPEECEDRLFINNLLGLYGGVFEDYSSLEDDLLETAIPLLYITGNIVPEYDFEIPTEFRITRPLDGTRLTVDSSWESYYITGTSDPKAPVFCNGEELERLSTNGTFGYLAALEYGNNTFEFIQNDETLTATIYRPAPSTAPVKISSISTYAASASTAVFQPYGPQAVNEQLPMLFQCTAPAGAQVTATLNGETYELEQTVSAQDGTAVVYKKEVVIPSEQPDEVVSIGKVTYTLNYNGNISEAEAPGEVFLVGENRTPMFRVKEGLGSVLNPSMENGDFMTTLKAGSVGEIVGQTANFFKTSYGGFITKASTTIVTDLENPENYVSDVEHIIDENGDEQLILHGTLCPSYIVDEEGGEQFVIRLIDTYGIPDGSIAADSVFFRDIQVKNDNGTTTITCLPGDESYFGYLVSYIGTDTILSFKAKPQLSSVKWRPLMGVRVVIDPGHGGNDVGALGVPGVTGPMEKNVNLYAALITRRYLEGLGATVYMTRETDEEFLELHERVTFTEQHDADIFLSFHHNSLVETLDPTRYDGTWVYWYNSISEGIADVMLKQITQASGRDPMGTESGYYVVLRNTIAPSVLLELGFMPNEKEYEEICSRDQMIAIAKSIADGVVEYIGSLQ